MNTSLEKLKTALAGDLRDYQSIPFWSWNHDLSPEELTHQIDQMNEAGIGGFIMHARTGLKMEYLGEEWFTCIAACLKRAKELGMNAWVYDENGWPSGFVGGKLLENEDFRARFLTYERKQEFDSSALGVYLEEPAGFRRITAPVAGVEEYHTVYLNISPANSDILNPRVVDAFIAETHEKYYERFKDSFGKELVGFFTDEPQYYRWGTPYSPDAAKIYAERYGEDMRDGLVYLFLHDARGYAFRTRYFSLLNELYVNNFYKKLYDWCEEHHCKLTGHSVDEGHLFSQMWGGAACMPTYEYEHIPGIDWLGRECGMETAPKQVGSVASQLGIHQVLTETFGCCGHDVTPIELKSLAEHQYFNGVNLMCQHLFPYSLAGQGKSDHPPVFSTHGNWWAGFRVFNDHFTRLGYLVANTKETYDALVIHPQKNVYLDYVRSEDAASVAKLDADFRELLLTLRKHGVRFQLADETILSKYGKAEYGLLSVGECAYSCVILPKMSSIARSTLSLLQDYKGKLLNLGEITLVDGEKVAVSLPSNMTEEELFQSAGIKFESDGQVGMTSREGEIGKYIFIKNYSRTEEASFRTEGVADRYMALDLETLTLSPIDHHETLPPCGSMILLADDAAAPKTRRVETEDITRNFALTGITENTLVLDMGAVSLDGEAFGEVLPLPRIFEDLLRQDYQGPLWIKQTFRTEEALPLSLLVEEGKYLSYTLNGQALSLEPTDFDVHFRKADLSAALKVGENELVYRMDYFQHEGVHFALFDPLATESLRNCLYYDTHIENAFLLGDFVLSPEHVLKKRTALPPMTSRLHEEGYPFFKGEVTLQGSFHYDGTGRCALKPLGRFLMADLLVNGKAYSLVLDPEVDITDALVVGENHITLRLHSGLRNMFGPLHFKPEPEPMGVSPANFNMRGTWETGDSPLYTQKYQSVPFGADRILLQHMH